MKTKQKIIYALTMAGGLGSIGTGAALSELEKRADKDTVLPEILMFGGVGLGVFSGAYKLNAKDYRGNFFKYEGSFDEEDKYDPDRSKK